MKKLFIIILLSACGTMGIGSNHQTLIYNQSKHTLSATGDSGIFKIQPDQNMLIYSENDIILDTKNKNCPQLRVMRKLNTPAVILDIIPGAFFGIIPIFVDAISNNLYRMPKTYSYYCN